MKKYIKDYLKIIAVSITGMIFVLTSFYLVMNYYHSEELKQQIYVSDTDIKLVTYKNTLKEIQENITSFRNKKNTDLDYDAMYNSLSTCYGVMTGPEVLYSIETNRYYSSNEIYKLGGNFQSQELNICWALHLSSIKEENKMKKFKEVEPFISNEVDTISKKTRNAMEEILNNSSYFYTTKITSVTIRNYLTSDYSMIVDSYQEFANIILNLSKMINKEGNNG